VDSHGEGERAGGEQVTEQQWTRREALAAAGGLFGFSGLCACDSTTKSSGPAAGVSSPQKSRPPEKLLEAAYSRRHGIDVPRTVLECPRGACILLHFPLREDYRPDSMSDLLSGRPGTDADDGQIVTEVGTAWHVERAGQLAQFNCCAYAAGDVIGLGPGDWLCGEVNPLTDGTNPMQVVLESYYERVAEFAPPFSERAIETFEASSQLREDDVVCLVGSHGPEFPHAMRVRRRGDRNWVVGKFGEDPILWTPLGTVGGAYEGQFDRVWVFRLSESSSRGQSRPQ